MYLTQREKKIMMLLLNQPKGILIDYIRNQLKVSERTVYRDMKSLEDVLANYRIKISNDSKRGYFLKGSLKNLHQLQKELDLNWSEELTTQQRQSLLIIELLTAEEEIKTEALANQYKVGISTIQLDLQAIEETLKALSRLVESGKVRYIGLSNETPWGVMTYLQLAKALGLARVVSVQNPYSLLNRTYEIGLAEIAHREQVGLLAYSPLGFGVLSGKYLDRQQPQGARLSLWGNYFTRYTKPLAQQVTKQYVDLAKQHGLDPAQMALAYVNSRPFVTSNIIGATTMQQLESNIASANLILSEDVLQGIEAIHEQQPNPCP